MSTCYYLLEDVCPHCKRPARRLRIGVSAFGWAFSLHIEPEERVGSLEDWQRLWAKPCAAIEDEYGRAITPEEMLGIITNRSHPRGLRHSDIDGRHCIAHGPGTWDLIIGEFFS